VGDGPPGLWADERLVAESDDDRRGAEFDGAFEAGAHRGHLSRRPAGVVVEDHTTEEAVRDHVGDGAGDDDDRSDVGRESVIDGALENGRSGFVVCFGQPRRQFVTDAFEPGSCTTGEQDDGRLDPRPPCV